MKPLDQIADDAKLAAIDADAAATSLKQATPESLSDAKRRLHMALDLLHGALRDLRDHMPLDVYHQFIESGGVKVLVFGGGTEISDACRCAVHYADKSGEPVCFKFNETVVVVKPGDTAGAACSAWGAARMASEAAELAKKGDGR